MEQDNRTKLIQGHLEAIRQLDAERVTADDEHWAPQRYYWLFHVMVGMMLGFIGAGVSLLANVIGSLLVDQHPLQLIRVYLTFPMGEGALEAESGKVMFVGCVLYLVTGGLYGIVFHLISSIYFSAAKLPKRMLIASIIGLSLWLINFYGILIWLQPALLDGNWIVEMVPIWVAAGTHLLFAWTAAIVEQWGHFESAATRPSVHGRDNLPSDSSSTDSSTSSSKGAQA